MSAVKYIVFYATYNSNEMKDSLCCKAFRDNTGCCKEFAMAYEAHEAIIKEIRRYAEAVLTYEGNDENLTAEELAERWIWRNTYDRVCEEHGGIETVYTIEAINA